MKCKKCDSEALRHSKRSSFEKAIGTLFPIRPYRCEACQERIWLLAERPFAKKDLIIWISFPTFMLLLMMLFIPLSLSKQSESQKSPEPPAVETGTNAETSAPETAGALTAEPKLPTPEVTEASVEEQSVPPAHVEETGPRVTDVDLKEPENADNYSAQARNKRSENLNKALQQQGNKPLTKQVTPAQPAPIEKAEKAPEAPSNRTVSAGKTAANSFTKDPQVEWLANGFTMKLETSQPIGNYRKVLNEKEHKFYLDIDGNWKGKDSKKVMRELQGRIKEIRFGFHPTFLRIVFEMYPNEKLPVSIEMEGNQIKATY